MHYAHEWLQWRDCIVLTYEKHKNPIFLLPPWELKGIIIGVYCYLYWGRSVSLSTSTLIYLFLLLWSVIGSGKVIISLHPHCQQPNSSLLFLIPLDSITAAQSLCFSSTSTHTPLIASACPFHGVISTVMHCDICLWARMLCSANCGQLC